MRQGWYSSRARAQDAIRSGFVRVNGRTVRRPGEWVLADSRVEREADAALPASRGAGKLGAALDRWGVAPTGWRVVDVGASTGGFTETWLRHGAQRVYAVDVGHHQLRAPLAADPRVVVLDGVNARNLSASQLAAAEEGAGGGAWTFLDAASIDVSFISLNRVLGPVARTVAPGGLVLALFKPQFEVGPLYVGKGGVVRDREAVGRVLQHYGRSMADWDLAWTDVMACPVTGRDGNREFWLHLVRGAQAAAMPDEAIADALAGAYGRRGRVAP